MYLPDDLRRLLDEADTGRCAYCQTAVANTGQPLTIDHVVPRALGGATVFANLCYACRRCNEFKGAATSTVDPLTGVETALFHPRQDRWRDHFAWDAAGVHIVGITAVGRATVVALNLNDEIIIAARHRWVGAGWHPPEIDS